MSELEKKLKSKAEYLKEKEPKLLFYRTASVAGFAEIFYQVLAGKTVSDDKWLRKIEYETDSNFTRRASTAKDLAWTKKVIDNYKGFFFGAKMDLRFDGPPEITDKMHNNIDNNGTTYKEFVGEQITEFLTVAYSNIITDAPPRQEGQTGAILPYTYNLKEEKVLDFAKDFLTGNFQFFRYKNHETLVQGIGRVFVKLYYAWTPERIIIGKQIDDNFSIVELVNELGYVPIHRYEISEGIPIIEPVAQLELDQMNLLSELRSIISSQAINLLHMPQTAWDSLEGLVTEKSVLIYPNNYDGPIPGFVAYPASGLDAHFRYNQLLVDSVYDVSSLKRKQTNQAESAASKILDFMDVESILNVLADKVEATAADIAEDWTNYTGKTITSQVSINKDSFNIQGLKDILENLLLAMAVGYGEKGKKALMKNSVESVFSGSTEEEKEQIKDEINQGVTRIIEKDLGEQI